MGASFAVYVIVGIAFLLVGMYAGLKYYNRK